MPSAATKRRTRLCAADGCPNLIGPEQAPQRKYCSPTCYGRMHARKTRPG